MRIEGSKHVDRAEYSPQHKMLTVRFHTTGQAYSYQNVPAEKWEAFQKSGSKGEYLHHEIIPNHRAWPAKNYTWHDE